MKKLLSRFGIGSVRIAVSAAVIATLVVLRVCGGDTAAVKRELVSGGSTVGVVDYVVGKYNEFTA